MVSDFLCLSLMNFSRVFHGWFWSVWGGCRQAFSHRPCLNFTYCLLPVAETLPAAHKWPAHSALTVTPAPSSPCTDPCLRAGRPVIGMLGRVGHGHRKKLKKICSLWAALDMDIALRCEKFDIRIRGTALWVVKAFLLASVSPNNALGWSWVTSLFSGFSFGLQQDVFDKILC